MLWKTEQGIDWVWWGVWQVPKKYVLIDLFPSDIYLNYFTNFVYLFIQNLPPFSWHRWNLFLFKYFQYSFKIIFKEIINHFFDILLNVSLGMNLKSQRAGIANINTLGQVVGEWGVRSLFCCQAGFQAQCCQIFLVEPEVRFNNLPTNHILKYIVQAKQDNSPWSLAYRLPICNFCFGEHCPPSPLLNW